MADWCTVPPWKVHTEFLDVRKHLFNLDGAEEREKGLDSIADWTDKYDDVPHAIDATAWLIEAMVMHQHTEARPRTIQASLAFALSRLVTGFCEPKERHGSRTKGGMREVAKSIDLPLELVDLRHEISHDKPPSLESLEKHAANALSWLWERFWSKGPESTCTLYEVLDLTFPANESDYETSTRLAPELEQEVRKRIKEFRQQRISELKSATDDSEDTNLVFCERFSDLAHLEKHGYILHSLVSILMIEDQTFLPLTRLDESISISFEIWDRLLLGLCGQHRVLLRILLARLCMYLNKHWTKGARREAVCNWIYHIYSDSQWRDVVDKVETMRSDRFEVIEKCLDSGDIYAMELVHRLVEKQSAEALSELSDFEDEVAPWSMISQAIPQDP